MSPEEYVKREIEWVEIACEFLEQVLDITTAKKHPEAMDNLILVAQREKWMKELRDKRDKILDLKRVVLSNKE